jgi:hypothetical protein
VAVGSAISDFGAFRRAQRNQLRRNRTVAAARFPGYGYVDDYISDLGASRGYRCVGIILGVFGLACLLALIIDGVGGSRVLPVGIVERGSTIAWEILTAAAILRRLDEV